MATRPTFTPVFVETENTIRQRMLDRVSDAWRKDPGDFIYDTVAPAAPEVIALEEKQDAILKHAFAQYAEDSWLDLKLEEIGLSRNLATAGKRSLLVEADAGVVIPKNHTASVVILDTGGNPVEYTVDAAVNFAASGTLAVDITCKLAGTVGNVPNGSQFILLPPIPGIKSITDNGITFPGADTESNQSAWERYDFKVKHPDTGGNKNDYIRWAQEVEGVGKVKIVPRWLGNGTVKVVLAGTDYGPATGAIVDDVQAYLDPKIESAILPAENGVTGGSGVAINDVADDVGTSVLFSDVAADGTLTFGDTAQTVEALLQTENHFTLRIKARASTSGTGNLFKATVRDRGTKVAFKQTKGGGTDAVGTFTGNQLYTAEPWNYVAVPFYWDGLQPVEIELRRLDATAGVNTVRVDELEFTSPYGQGLGYGKAPGGARVTVAAADSLTLNIAADVTLVYGADPNVVKTAFENAVKEYLKTLVFVPGASVVYAKIGGLLIGTANVVNYTGLTINGAAADVAIGAEQVPVLGTVTLT